MPTREYLLQNHKFFSLNLDLMLAAVANTQLPLVYRSHMLNLLSLLFLDCKPNTEVRFLNPILLSKNKFRRTSSFEDPMCQGYFLFAKFPELAPDLKYPELKRVVMKVCQDEAKFSDHSDLNVFSCSLLLVLGQLLRFGKFGMNEITTPVATSPLISERNELHNDAAIETMQGKKDLNELDQLIPILVKMLETPGNCRQLTRADCCLSGNTAQAANAKSAIEAKLWVLETISCLFN